MDPTDPLLLAVRTGLEPFAELACAVLFGSAAAERATGRNVDLLFLNRAPATVCAAAVLTGTPVLLRNAAIFSRYRLAVTDVAIDFWATERDFRAIRNRSASLNEADRAR